MKLWLKITLSVLGTAAAGTGIGYYLYQRKYWCGECIELAGYGMLSDAANIISDWGCKGCAEYILANSAGISATIQRNIYHPPVTFPASSLTTAEWENELLSFQGNLARISADSGIELAS